MVLGMSWAKPRSIGFSAQTPESTIVDPQWASDRGRFVMQASADLAGGFPGYARRGARVANADLRLYQRALVVDEGRDTGFALAIEAVVGVDADPLPSGGAHSVRIRYIDGQLTRLFTIAVRPSRAPRRSARPEPTLLQHLGHLGFGSRPVDAVTTARYHVPFDDTDGFADERVVWNGAASAPIQLGGALDRVEVWVTDRSLVWAHERSGVVDRVPLEEVRDAASGQAGSRNHRAVAYVGIGLGPLDRVEVPFVFDAHASAADNAHVRSTFVGALFSRGIATVQINTPWQPWCVVATPTAAPAATGAAWPAHVTPIGVSPALDEALRQASATPAPPTVAERTRQATSAADRLRPDRGVVIHGSDSYGTVHRDTQRPAAVTAPALPQPSAPVGDVAAAVTHDSVDELAIALADDAARDGAGDASNAAELASAGEDVLEAVAVVAPAAEESAATTATPPAATSAAERLEKTAIAAIKAAIDTITARRDGDWLAAPAAKPASDADRAAALAEVIEEMASGAISAASAVFRKKRLEALADAAVRLHGLLDEHAAGRVTIEHLVAERIRIDSGLTHVVAQG